jgi:hypothetical protein
VKIPQAIGGTSSEQLVERGGIAPELAARLLVLERRWEARFPGLGSLRIISGFRTADEQNQLDRDGRPAAPDHLSTHRNCPATGADLELPIAVDRSSQLELGYLVLQTGLRWGGGSPVQDGVPSDWNHVDLGPRVQ